MIVGQYGSRMVGNPSGSEAPDGPIGPMKLDYGAAFLSLLAGGVFIGIAYHLEYRWKWGAVPVAIAITIGTGIGTCAAFVWLSRRCKQSTHNIAGYRGAGVVTTEVVARYILGTLSVGIIVLAVAWIGSERWGWSSFMAEVLVEAGGGLCLVVIVVIIELALTRRPVDAGYRPERTGDLCHLAEPPSPVEYEFVIDGAWLVCAHEPPHHFDLPIVDLNLLPSLVPGFARRWRYRVFGRKD